MRSGPEDEEWPPRQEELPIFQLCGDPHQENFHGTEAHCGEVSLCECL